MANLKLVVLSPQKKILETECLRVTIHTVDGLITVLPRHIPLFTQMAPGEVLIKKANGEITSLAVGGGFANVHDNEIVLLAEFGIISDEINEQQVTAAKARAEEILKSISDEKSTSIAQADLARSVLQLKVAHKRHHHP